MGVEGGAANIRHSLLQTPLTDSEESLDFSGSLEQVPAMWGTGGTEVWQE